MILVRLCSSGFASIDPAKMPRRCGSDDTRTYRNRWPSGRNCGARCAVSPAVLSSEVIGVGVPPAADTRRRPGPRLGAKTITPSLFHVPPETEAGTSQIVWGGPPEMSSFLSWPGRERAWRRRERDEPAVRRPEDRRRQRVAALGTGERSHLDRIERAKPHARHAVRSHRRQHHPLAVRRDHRVAAVDEGHRRSRLNLESNGRCDRGTSPRRPRRRLAITAIAPMPAAIHVQRGFAFVAGCGSDLTTGTSSTSAITSPICRSRFCGSFSRHRRSRRWSWEGTFAQFGSSLITDASTSVLLSPVCSRVPVTISYSTTPNA